MERKSLVFHVPTEAPKARRARAESGNFYWRHIKDVSVYIDEEDWPLVKDMDWRVVVKNGKPTAVVSGVITLQRVVFQEINIPPQHGVFHKDGDPLNNTKANLYLCRTFRGKRIEVKNNAF